MTDAELLAKVKYGLGITGTFQDNTLNVYIAEVKAFMKSAGVADSVIRSERAVGCIIRGVADLWNYGAGNASLSQHFKMRLVQLKTSSTVKEVEALSVTANGTYTAEEGTAFTPVVVNIPAPALQNKTITANGTYTADAGYDGLGTVTVNMQAVTRVTGDIDLTSESIDLSNGALRLTNTGGYVATGTHEANGRRNCMAGFYDVTGGASPNKLAKAEQHTESSFNFSYYDSNSVLQLSNSHTITPAITGFFVKDGDIWLDVSTALMPTLCIPANTHMDWEVFL